MRATAIPAQITTVEDRIVGSLNLSQLLLLATPIFGGGLLYAMSPPMLAVSAYKILLLALFTGIGGILAIRIKGMIVLHWVAILFRYWQRPRYYVFDKHSMHGRQQHKVMPEEVNEVATEAPEHVRLRPSLSLEDLTKVQELIRNPAANIAYEIRKGGLYVRITEVEQES
jgi:hypothetical protein